MGLVRRRRPLAVAALQHAGDLGARLQVKDDSTCLCSDLVAGTHGRGFWILDDVTPLRQAAEARAAGDGERVPVQARSPRVRVRFGTNDPTPWPPEVPAGENPPPGGIIDYYLAARRVGAGEARDPRRRGESGAHATRAPIRCIDPDPAIDPVAYNKICQHDADRAGLRPAALLAGAAA